MQWLRQCLYIGMLCNWWISAFGRLRPERQEGSVRASFYKGFFIFNRRCVNSLKKIFTLSVSRLEFYHHKLFSGRVLGLFLLFPQGGGFINTVQLCFKFGNN